MKCRVCFDSGYMRVRIPLRPFRASDFVGGLEGAETKFPTYKDERAPCEHCEKGHQISEWARKAKKGDYA